MGRPPGSEERSRLGLLRREPSFRRLFLATLGSGLGTWLALVALEWDVFHQTHSSAWIAALLIADLLPTFAIGLLAGPLVDRLPRRGLMVIADLVRFGAFAVLPFTTERDADRRDRGGRRCGDGLLPALRHTRGSRTSSKSAT